jgi:surfeit locus 1 family protein
VVGASAGRTTIIGLIRPDDPAQFFTPENRPEENLFFSRSVQALSQAKGLQSNGPPEAFTVDLLAFEGGPMLPQAGETRMTFSNNHLGYALTWYGLAAALLAVFASFAWTQLRGEIGAPRLTPPGPAP